MNILRDAFVGFVAGFKKLLLYSLVVAVVLLPLTEFFSDWIAPVLPFILLIIAIAVIMSPDYEKVKRDELFMKNSAVAHEITHIVKHAFGPYSHAVIAKRTDGMWGIADYNGWINVGQGKYIAGRWKQLTGRYPKFRW